MERRTNKYDLKQIYRNEALKNLWPVEHKLAKQMFLDHSNEQPNMFNIPSIWVPIVKLLMENLITIDPDIYFYQVKERFGMLSVHVKSLKHKDFAQRLIDGASRAVDVITIVHST